MYPTLQDTIHDITDEIAFCHEQIRYFDSLADLEKRTNKFVMKGRIAELKVARRRLLDISKVNQDS